MHKPRYTTKRQIETKMADHAMLNFVEKFKSVFIQIVMDHIPCDTAYILFDFQCKRVWDGHYN